MVYSPSGSSDLFFDPRLLDLQSSCTWAFSLGIFVLGGTNTGVFN